MVFNRRGTEEERRCCCVKEERRGFFWHGLQSARDRRREKMLLRKRRKKRIFLAWSSIGEGWKKKDEWFWSLMLEIKSESSSKKSNKNQFIKIAWCCQYGEENKGQDIF
ncbi:hypothetical protein ILUMI_09072 [Ignelater luminosus]|uniref:Uncharacterized protein n=1 Tax=Ignelater luminosus TaxID=2038154 RepID=A0A8K0GFD9_IGNLU|nr:hypothetical protein ILUMI_09072 [Ignelater luminosus]